MIYVLIVLYNSKIKLNQISNIRKEGLTPVIFDNSDNCNFVEDNIKISKKNNIEYNTLNLNVGLSNAYNYIIRKYISENDWIAILDQDTDVPAKYYYMLNKYSTNSTNYCYFSIFEYGHNKYGPKIILEPSRYKTYSVHQRKKNKGYLIGINSCSFIKGIIFKKIGLFNEKLFMDYIDVDFSLRMALNKIQASTIDVNLKQHFFSKERAAFGKVKKRLSIQKHDAKIFYASSYLKGFLRKKYLYVRDILKFILLYCKANNLFWFIPLILVKPIKNMDFKKTVN